MKVLYVEDDPTAREFVVRGLEEAGMRVEAAEDGEQALERASSVEFDVLLLDVMLPGIDGFDLLQGLRSRGVDTPALYLSARDEVSDRVRGLDLGADDYLRKPFAFAELVARLRAVVRRRRGGGAEDRLQIGDLVVDLSRQRVERAGRECPLTPKEFLLLEYLVRNAGHVLSRAMITERVWGYGFESYSNLIDVHIKNLRDKVDRGFGFPIIHTVKGIGYVAELRGPDSPMANGEEGDG